MNLRTLQISWCAWTLRQLSRNWQSNTEVNHINNKSQSNRVKIHSARYVECSSEAGKYEIQSVQSFFRRKMTLFWSSASHAFTQFYFSPFSNAQHILNVSAAGWDTWIWWSNAWKCTTSSRNGKPHLRDGNPTTEHWLPTCFIVLIKKVWQMLPYSHWNKLDNPIEYCKHTFGGPT